MTDEPINPGQEEIEALDRIARSPDGRLMHRYLRRVLEACHDFTEQGALLAQNGRRTLARDLMRHMAQGIEGSRDRRSDHRGDEPVLTRDHKPTNVSRRSSRRRVEPDPGVDAFLRDHGADPA